MQRKNGPPPGQRPGFTQEQRLPSQGERWIDLLSRLIPIGRLVTPAAPVDPIPGLAMPAADASEDPAMISAYYLSFYE